MTRCGNIAPDWDRGLSLDLPLRFELMDVLVGVAQVTLYYRSVGRRVVAETLFIDGSGKATRGIAQWSVTNTKEQLERIV
jgi:hypothetical protein